MSLLHHRLGVDPVVARGLSFPIAVTCTWLLNRYCTFDGCKPGAVGVEYVRYSLVQVIGAAVNLTVFFLLLETVSALAALPVVALSAGAACSLCLNYWLLRTWVYSARPPAEPGAVGYSGVANLEVMAAAERYNNFLVDLVQEAAPFGARQIVDFGAGTGTFSGPLAAVGLPVVAVEPDPNLAERLKIQGLPVHGALSELPEGSVDYLYSLNVLEHIKNDDEALRQCSRVLRSGGNLLIYVPAFMILFGPMDRLVGHYRRYRLAELRHSVVSAGFQVSRIEYVDSIGFFAALLFRFIGSSSGTLSPVAVRLYDRYCFPLSRRLDSILRGVCGKNLLVIARRLPSEAQPDE